MLLSRAFNVALALLHITVAGVKWVTARDVHAPRNGP